jgi:hypothetical protein
MASVKGSTVPPDAARLPGVKAKPSLAVILGQIARLTANDVAGWSDIDLKGARAICERATTFFNDSLKQQGKPFISAKKSTK